MIWFLKFFLLLILLKLVFSYSSHVRPRDIAGQFLTTRTWRIKQTENRQQIAICSFSNEAPNCHSGIKNIYGCSALSRHIFFSLSRQSFTLRRNHFLVITTSVTHSLRLLRANRRPRTEGHVLKNSRSTGRMFRQTF